MTRVFVARELAKAIRAEITAEVPTEIALDHESAKTLRGVLLEVDVTGQPGLEELKRHLTGPGFDAGPLNPNDDLPR